MESDIVKEPISEIAPKIKSKKISPLELVRAYLAVIERLDETLKAFITVTADLAVAQARQAEREIVGGLYRGPLHGIPIAVKDIIQTAGVRTTAGSRILADHIPATDAVVWQRLRDSGCILIGKTNLHEFARGSTTNNPHFGRCRNPWDLHGSRIPGGSSGGSGAAVAACLCAGALGTDTLGSVRKPAADCGIVGLKPTYDLVSRRGVVPLSWSLDHVGPMTKTVADTGIMLHHMAGRTNGRPGKISLDTLLSNAFRPKGLKIGIVKDWWNARCNLEVQRAFEAALALYRQMGCDIVELDFPHMNQIFAAGRIVSICEAVTYHESWLKQRSGEYGDDVLKALIGGATISARDYIHALRIRTWAIERFRELFKRADLIAAPCTIEPAPKLEDLNAENSLDIAFYTGPANLVGIPAVAVPCGMSADGIPIGMQLMAPHHRDDLALSVAGAYEARTDWHRLRPPVCT